ncbi:cell envelope biogenesis protein TolA [Caulobacter radicis]|uniref:Cell envelope biogenesis protein TolA n=1 Tax=Caulobacter radicis TaxID=2172650 RepID=A0A2T9IVR5_9CAUL|nr:cell envelope biogenesis protein TolA [Caulobacter radicis]PVM70944.1 cell envelope biogenesis protein TolA [Caulobacter radicis]PVM87716.1 cell envelope biogenesis protein TolA [Caulobacter radicis]
MARAPAPRRLKVYQAQFGFHDSVVAAPNQAAALAAWGTRQNLFAEGRAKVSDDPHAAAVALAHPEVPLRRAVGSQDPFSLDPGLPQVPDPPPRGKPALKVLAKAAPVALAGSPPDRSALDAAQKALASINARRLDEEKDFERRRKALEAEELAARQAWAKARKTAETALEAARRSYRAAGGDA